MKTSKFLTITALTLLLSTSGYIGNAASSKDFSVAVVDIQQIVEKSPAINALKIDRKNKLDDLAAFVEKARADVAKATNDSKKKTLEAGYNKELNTRKEAIDADYAKKLSDIDRDVTSLIKSTAKEGGYSLTLTKNVVVDGGDDITAEVIKNLK